MALVYKVHIQGDSDNTAPYPLPVPSLHPFGFYEIIFIILICVTCIDMHTNNYTGTAYFYQEKL